MPLEIIDQGTVAAIATPRKVIDADDLRRLACALHRTLAPGGAGSEGAGGVPVGAPHRGLYEVQVSYQRELSETHGLSHLFGF